MQSWDLRVCVKSRSKTENISITHLITSSFVSSVENLYQDY